MFDTVDDLTSAVTAVLGPIEPLARLTQSLTDALDSVWAEFFGASTPPGSSNWNAYSHEQLYRMLWENADVGDVSAVAAEWGRHSAALTGYAEELRGQGSALRSNWQGRAAEQAADRLAELSDRVWNAGARAGAVQKAADDAGEALALARNTMPPPPPDPFTLMTSAVGAGPLPPLQALVVGGARLFTADAVAGASKAEAVRVMQRYESSLRDSAHQVVPGQADPTTPNRFQVDGSAAAAQTTAAAAVAGGGGAFAGRGSGSGGGEPWSRLVGRGSPGFGGLTGIGPGIGPVPGLRAAAGAGLSEAAAKRSMPGGGFFPPGMARAADDDERERRRSHLPTVDHRLFTPEERGSAPVIGDLTDGERDIVR